MQPVNIWHVIAKQDNDRITIVSHESLITKKHIVKTTISVKLIFLNLASKFKMKRYWYLLVIYCRPIVWVPRRDAS